MTREEAIIYFKMRLAEKTHPPTTAQQKAFTTALEALQEPERKWIPCSERFPNKEEYLKDDGRFILDDGNRRYLGLFDIYDGKFKFSKHVSGLNYELLEDKCVKAWMPLPEPYKGESK